EYKNNNEYIVNKASEVLPDYTPNTLMKKMIVERNKSTSNNGIKINNDNNGNNRKNGNNMFLKWKTYEDIKYCFIQGNVHKLCFINHESKRGNKVTKNNEKNVKSRINYGTSILPQLNIKLYSDKHPFENSI